MDVSPNSISKESYAIVLFYAPWCGHCKRFKPVFEEIKNSLGNCNIKTYEINLDIFPNPPSWMTAGAISTVPRIVLLKQGLSTLYEGERTVQDIVKWSCTPNGVPNGLTGGFTGHTKIELWRMAIHQTLNSYRVPKKGTQDYLNVMATYKKLLQ